MTAEEQSEMERLKVMVEHLHTHLDLTQAKLDAERKKNLVGLKPRNRSGQKSEAITGQPILLL